MTITIPPSALEKAARRAVLFNGGDPDKQLRLTLQGKTIAQWEQVAPLIEAACLAMLQAWPGMLVAAPDSWVRCRRDGPTTILPMSNGNIILPLTENSNERE